jgi:hypothetical protein
MPSPEHTYGGSPSTVHSLGSLVHGAQQLWYVPWEAFLIEGLKNAPEKGWEAWLLGRLRT